MPATMVELSIFTSCVITRNLPATMATTTVTQTISSPALNLILQNGEKIFFHSDTSIEADEIPVIDIEGIYSDDINERKAVAEKIREAAHRIGFFYIVNHRIDPTYSEHTFEQAKRFFAQSEEKKMEVCTDLVAEYFGYFPMARVSNLKSVSYSLFDRL
jgi:hypothetical protein